MTTFADNTQIKFVEAHVPSMRAGEYHFTFHQDLKYLDTALSTNYSTEQHVAVGGNRFTLDPNHLHSVFPPNNNIGDHANAIPSITLKRSTLPWEWIPCKEGQNPEGDNEKTPWMCLLILNEDEKLGGCIKKDDFFQAIDDDEDLWAMLLKGKWILPTSDKNTFIVPSPSERTAQLPKDYLAYKDKIEQFLNESRDPKTETIQTLQNASKDTWIKWPGFDKKVFEKNNTQVTLGDFDRSLLNKIMPLYDELRFLTHVRSASQKLPDGFVTNEWAIVCTNRLPQPNKRTTAYLISLQGRIDLSTSKPSYTWEASQDNALIRFPILKQWSFSCISHKHSLTGILRHLNTYLQDKDSDNTSAPPKNNTSTFTFRLPPNGNPIAEQFLALGKIPLIHNMRMGTRSVSWYQGPLTTNQHLHELTPPKDPEQPLIEAADQLLMYNRQTGMYDVSYAAAWELGRMLLLSEKDLAIKLFHWKRHHKQQLRAAEQAAVYRHIPFQNGSEFEFPPELQKWFEDLRLLKGIPAEYLIPNPALLPPESIRFFQIDEQWLEALIDGAYSIGRVAYQDKTLPPNPQAAKPYSGILLRSAAVKEWPDLLVDAYATLPTPHNLDEALAPKLTLLRMDHLSDNTLICIFDGLIQTVDIHLRPEAIHTGFKPLEDLPQSPINQHFEYQKDLRDHDGTEMEESLGDITFSIAWRNPKATDRIISIANTIERLTDQLQSLGQDVPKPFTSAQLAFFLLEGVPKVRFIQKRS